MNLEIIITQWALDAYLELKDKRVFSPQEYWDVIRPDVLLLKSYPQHIRFKQQKFWSPAQDHADQIISNGFKMKWHQVGEGKVQLRLPVGILTDSFLCAAYVKNDSKQEKRQLAKFKVYMQLIQQNRYIVCGRLS